jgi:hypothetical protein
MSLDIAEGAASAMANSMMHRVGGNREYDIEQGSYGKLVNYLMDMEHAVNFLPVAESYNMLVGKSSPMRDLLIGRVGATKVAQLEEQMDHVISRGQKRQRATGAFDNSGIGQFLKL